MFSDRQAISDGPVYPSTVGKPSMSMGTLSWFHNVSTDHGDVIEY